MSETCESCRFRGGIYKPADHGIAGVDGLTFACRRNAPLVTGGLHAPTMTVWPWIRLDGWCGEYQRKDRPDAD